jgi:hypothetical protein
MIKRIPLEAILWSLALGGLALYTPSETSHFTLCPFSNLGFDFCPGCGLGHSISYLFHGDFYKSFDAHPLGMFAVVVLSFRILQLLKPQLKTYGQNNRHPS